MYGRARTLDWSTQGKPKNTDLTFQRTVLKRGIMNDTEELRMPVRKLTEEAVETNFKTGIHYWDIKDKVGLVIKYRHRSPLRGYSGGMT